MNPTRALPSASLTLGLALLFGLTASGCSSKSGREVPPGQANLEVQNAGSKTLHVHVDLAEIGQVSPGSTGFFYVSSGFRALHYRERGDASLEHQGDWDFRRDEVLRLTYDPANPFTLRLTNASSDRVQVFVGLDDVGSVPPQTTALLQAPPGRYEVRVARVGHGSDAVGTFNFSRGMTTEVRYP